METVEELCLFSSNSRTSHEATTSESIQSCDFRMKHLLCNSQHHSNRRDWRRPNARAPVGVTSHHWQSRLLSAKQLRLQNSRHSGSLLLPVLCWKPQSWAPEPEGWWVNHGDKKVGGIARSQLSPASHSAGYHTTQPRQLHRACLHLWEGTLKVRPQEPQPVQFGSVKFYVFR